jgi:HAD superfamily hydrolase (TIGR01509 family)
VSPQLAALPDPDAVLFDLDGTLVDTVETRIDAWLEAFGESALPADRRHVAALIGSDGKRLARAVAALGARRLDDEEAERLDHRSGEIYDRLNTDPQPLPGARELLARLAAGRGLAWAIATSSRPEQVRRSVESLELAGEPPIVDGSHVEAAKPAPDLLLLAARQLGVAPERCWYVGDSVWDVAAAVAAGQVPIGVATGAVSREVLQGAAAAVALDGLEPLLADLSRRGAIDGGR